jgi:GH24 family phage-related lysozyme (muramidase)
MGLGYTPDQHKLSKRNPRDRLRGGGDLDFGIYVGEVIVRPKDETHTGRIPVYIPMLGKDRNDPSGYYNAYWTSPFAGSTPSAKLGPNTAKYADTMKSYGMWAVPPDPGNFVLVAFADGKKKFPVIVSCLFPDQLQFMVPGNASSSTFGTSIAAPTGEKNKREDNPNHSFASQRPINPFTTLPLTNQGLLLDNIRGTTTSSARRESPSEVFGILTPGPDRINPDTGKVDGTNRMGGHSFVMDDNLSQRHIRLRTGGGAQILMDDTNQLIYVINHKGNAWAEITSKGEIHLYSGDKFNIRALGDVNIRSDANVNIEALDSINLNAGVLAENSGKIKAQAGNSQEFISGSGGSITEAVNGGAVSVIAETSILMQAGESINTTSGSGTFLTAGGAMNIKSGGETTSQAAGRNNIVGSTVHLNDGGSAASAITPELVPQHELNAYIEPPAEPISFDIDEQNTSADANPFPSNGLRDGSSTDRLSICTEFTTREPWYGHTIELNSQANQRDMIQATDTDMSSKPSTIPGDTQPMNQPKPGAPGEVVQLQKPAQFITPAGGILPLSTPQKQIPAGSTVAFIDATIPGTTTALNSAAGHTRSADMTSYLDSYSEGVSDIISTTPNLTEVGVPYGVSPTGAPTQLSLGQVIGKNHFCQPSEIAAGCVVMGSPGSTPVVSDLISAVPTNTITIDPNAKLPITGLGSLSDITRRIGDGEDASFLLAYDGVTQEGNTFRIQDIRDPSRIVTIQPLNKPMSETTATALLRADYENARLWVGKSLRSAPGLSSNNFVSLVSFAQSVGYTNWLTSGVKDAVMTGNYDKVAYEMMKWTRLNGKSTDPVLTARRIFEARSFNLPDAARQVISSKSSSWGIKSQRVTSWYDSIVG